MKCIKYKRNILIFITAILTQLLWVSYETYSVIYEAIESSNYVMLLKLLLMIPVFLMASFFINIIITCIINIFIPISYITRDSKYYVCDKNVIMNDTSITYPHITIQIPVYKESFEHVIKPTLSNVISSCKYYENNFKNASYTIFVNDDGLMTDLLTNDEKNERMDFYRKNYITYIARPSKNRYGKFKKAGNMNFCLRQAVEVEKHTRLISSNRLYIDSVNDYDRNMCFCWIYSRAEYLIKLAKDNGFIAGSCGCNPIIGKYFLILDSDSRISEKSLGTIINELEKQKTLGFAQIFTQAMQIQYDYWENMISHFTNNIYSLAFILTASSGDPSPLVGHNVIIPWKVIKDTSWLNDKGQQIYWSEDHVSEDFHMSLRIQTLNLDGKYFNIHDTHFLEGVSLSIDEEYVRFKKYAYGVSELLMNPVSQWCKKSIFGDTFVQYFKCSNISFVSKYNMLAYFMSYYTLALGPIMTITNYFAFTYSKWWTTHLLPPINIVVGSILIYSVLLPISNISLKWKLGNNLWETIKNEIGYGIMLGLFFGGIGYHIIVSFISHLFGLKISWSTTNKEIQNNSRFEELKRIINTFRTMYCIMLFLMLLTIVFTFIVPEFMRIDSYISVIPMTIMILCHILSPILLNPTIMCRKNNIYVDIV